jgi:chromosomal replication initiation ATPase DnaA
MEEGIGQGHQGKYYATIDQRFLGDEPFVSQVAERSDAKEIEIRGKQVGFAKILQAVCAAHGVEAKAIVQAGRKRQWVGVRAQLVHLARQWCGLTVKELGRRLNRDPSIISRLYAWYETHRGEPTEKKLARLLMK